MGLKPSYSSDFELLEEGKYLFNLESIEFTRVEKGLNAKSKCIVLECEANPDLVGRVILDNFPLYVEFGIRRLLGLLVKAANAPEKEYPAEFFEDEKTQAKVVKQLSGAIFGGRIKHSKSTKKEGTVMANIADYYTKDEYKAIIAKEAQTEKKADATEKVPTEKSTTEAW